MDLKILSSSFRCDILGSEHVQEIFKLCSGNPQYYAYCPPEVTPEGVLEDMKALPPGKSPDDKYYIGFRDDQRLVAVMDLIAGYPDKETVYIGFFMVEKSYQGKGVGSQIIRECLDCLKQDFSFARLGFVKGNKQSEHFWLKNGFEQSGPAV